MSTTNIRGVLEALESREVPASPSVAPSLGPPPAPSANVIWVSTAAQLQNAVQNLQSNRTIVIQPGTYVISSQLTIGNGQQVSNVNIRGATDNYGDVVILGAGMDNNAVWFGFSLYNAQDVFIANVSVGAVYYSAVELHGESGAARLHLYHVRLFDSGEQLIKSNPGASTGADNCIVEYCLMEYTNGPSTVDHGPGVGYTNGISALRVNGWQIRNNLFRNFHTPDTAAYHWNPVVLMWGYSQNTVVEGNTFIDGDRAIALGLIDQSGGFDHQGGVVRNNFVYQHPGLFSAARRAGSDGQIIAYDSPGTEVYHNTILTNNNSLYSIEVRWGNTGVVFTNNLADAPLRARDGGVFTGSSNYRSATASMFVNAPAADLHLVNSALTQSNVIDHASAFAAATDDFDLGNRPIGSAADIGADEYIPPVRVQSVTMNDGSVQRSRITSVTVNFDQMVTLPANPAAAFQLIRSSDSAVVTLIATVSNTTVTAVTLTFTNGPVEFGSLADGRYTLTALAAQITNLDGNGDGTVGDDYTLVGTPASGLFRLFGDADGDGTVAASDFIQFRLSLGGANPIFDFDNDGAVAASDFIQFRLRFGGSI